MPCLIVWCLLALIMLRVVGVWWGRGSSPHLRGELVPLSDRIVYLTIVTLNTHFSITLTLFIAFKVNTEISYVFTPG